MKSNFKNLSLSIIGLGYVGLPLAIEFGKYRKVIAYDNNIKRIKDLKKGIDNTQEISKNLIKRSKNIFFTYDSNDLKQSNCFIVCVPTPINKKNKPDLNNITSATKLVANYLPKNSIVIYESTVYPGLTEEYCVPLISKISGLSYNKDFFCGYSPERVNPGDKTKKINNIKKLVSGSNKKITDIIYKLYNEINKNNIIKVSEIKIAEAAKVIENCQRDVNIAFMNELSIIFKKLNINTYEVLEAAATKWNFGKYMPGLVGGHCIGVDPYYLSYRSSKSGYNPKIILSGRKINNSMPEFVVKNFINGMKAKKIKIKNSKTLILGLTFKENCPDIRNSKVFSVIEKLKAKSINVFVHDPWITIDKSKDYDFNMINEFNNIKFDGIILAVGHDKFKMFNDNILKKLSKKNYFFYDLKNFFKKSKLVNLTL